MDYKRQTEELNKIPIRTVGLWLGLELPKQGSTNCPFPDHDDKNPSFEIRSQSNRWICYGCGRKGGAIDFVKEYLGKDFIEAKQWLADNAGHSITKLTRSSSISPVQVKIMHDNITEDESDPDHELYKKFISLCPLRENGRAYLTRRAISEETIQAFSVCQLDSAEYVLKTLLSEFGFERTKKSGVLTKKSTEEMCRLVFVQDSIVFPFIEAGRISYLQARYFGNSFNRSKWMNLNNRHHRIYNVDILNRSELKVISICEGVMDALSAIELKFNAIGLMGVSAKFTVDQIMLLKGRHVDILLDWDEQGNRRAAQLQNDLKKYGVMSTRLLRPSNTAVDMNEYLIEVRRLT